MLRGPTRDALPPGGGRCAAHVPPRCRWEKKSISECHEGFRAAIHALGRSGDCMQQANPKNLENRAPRGPKSSPRAPKSSSDASTRAKMHPRGAQEHLRGTQERPTHAQEAPKRHRKAPRRRPRDAQESPRPLQNRARRTRRRIFRTTFVGKPVRKAPGSTFRSFSADLRVWRQSADLEFYRPCRRF